LTNPSEVGLSADALQKAGDGVGSVGTMFCMYIVKDGALVYDRSYDGFGKAHRRIETMSAGKTVTALLMGAAEHQGLFDVDTPLHHYGVKPLANWSKLGTDFFPFATARHLLTQSSGLGEIAPGTAFTYDSDEYIQHLSHLLNATAMAKANSTAREWANENFAYPLGLRDLYAYQQGDPLDLGDKPAIDPVHSISAGGDMPMTCQVIMCIINGSYSNISAQRSQRSQDHDCVWALT
jgi:CubicO group peptidase (beta-lactamase class C family)